MEVVVGFVFGLPFTFDFGLTLGLVERVLGWGLTFGRPGWPLVEVRLVVVLDELLEELELLEVVDVAPVAAVQVWVTLCTGSPVSVCGSTVAPAGRSTLNTSC